MTYLYMTRGDLSLFFKISFAPDHYSYAVCP